MRREFAFLNLFRAFAAAWVLVGHCEIWAGDLRILPPGIAVDLFMMISGFLMCVIARDMDTPEGRLRFWTQRFFRLAPAYYVSLALAALLAPWFLGGYAQFARFGGWHDPAFDPSAIHYTPANLLFHASLLFGLSPQYVISTFLPDWSLSLEWQFYLAFPLVYVFMRKRGSEAVLAVAAMSLVVGGGLAELTDFAQPSLLLFKLQFFAAGMLAYRAVTGGNLRDGIYAVLAILFAPGPSITVKLLIAMLVVGRIEVIAPQSPLRFITDNRLVRFMSNVSYGVYLFHGFFIAACGLLLARYPELAALPMRERVVGMVAFVSVGSYATGWVVHWLIERPGIALGRRLSQRRVAAPSAAVVEGRALG